MCGADMHHSVGYMSEGQCENICQQVYMYVHVFIYMQATVQGAGVAM